MHDDDKRAEIYLANEELDVLYDMELDGKEEQIRALFLIGVFCAQRISDFSRLTKKNFKVTSNDKLKIAKRNSTFNLLEKWKCAQKTTFSLQKYKKKVGFRAIFEKLLYLCTSYKRQ